jgi:hypothetical protein
MTTPDRGFLFAIKAGLALAVLAWTLAPAGLSWAALITPYVNFTGGWSDNIRLTKAPRSDFYIKAGPGIRGEWKWPGHEFIASGEMMYAKYLDLNDLDGFDSASVGAIYKYEPSPRWHFEINDRFTSTFDKAELGDTGELVTVRDDTGRVDRNTITIRATHQYSQHNSMEAAYTNTYTRGESDAQETSMFNRLSLVWTHRLNYQWEFQAGGSVVRTDYNESPDEDRGRAFTRLTRLVGPTKRIWGEVSYTINQAATETDVVGNARNYKVTAFNAGIFYGVSPRLDWRLSAGWSYVSGDQRSNDAASRGFPTLNGEINYRGQRWRLRGYAIADLGQFDYLGDNSGLTVSHRAGMTWSYELTRLQSLSLTAEYVRNDYQEAQDIAQTSNQGVVDSYRFIARWNWQIHKRLRLSLEYSYLNRDAEVDDDDREQNQVLLMLYTDYPFRWQ